MRSNLFILVMGLSFFLAACGGKKEATVATGEQATKAEATAAAQDFTVDVDASTLAWTGKKVTGQHNGTIQISNGVFSVESGNITAGNFAIDMTTIANNDLAEDAETQAKLLGHLSSPDFFNVAEHPTATFEITSVAALEGEAGATHNISGNLTIKGISKEITFPATVSMNGGSFNAEADFNIDRTEWDIRYGSGKFFEDLGDKTIYDDINLKLALSAGTSDA
ncbi:MAG: YceI family protein [Bacteroidia bacterium]|nr:YceI family protein [Bacteroidia bacterium]